MATWFRPWRRSCLRGWGKTGLTQRYNEPGHVCYSGRPYGGGGYKPSVGTEVTVM